jgi:hypothetical protein
MKEFGFTYTGRPIIRRPKTQRMEGFKEGSGKWVSEIYTEEATFLVRFSNGKEHILTTRYTEFRHDVNNPEDKTVIDWHWINFPSYYGEDVTWESIEQL